MGSWLRRRRPLRKAAAATHGPVQPAHPAVMADITVSIAGQLSAAEDMEGHRIPHLAVSAWTARAAVTGPSRGGPRTRRCRTIGPHRRGLHPPHCRRPDVPRAVGTTTVGQLPHPAKVARELAQLAAAGLTGIAISLVNYRDELPYFCAEALPRPVRLGVREPA